MFSESVKNCILNYVKFRGRTSRKVYWYFLLLVAVVNVCQYVFVLDYVLFSGSMSMIFSMLFSLVALFFLVPFISATCRRLHDIGKAAPFIFVFLIPIVGLILFFIWTTRKSDGNNAFGKVSSIDAVQ